MIGVIGGSGLYKIDGVKTLEEIPMETPFGSPSGPIAQLEYQGQQFFFIARHGEGHRLNPSEINYRANIFALKKLGVKKIISVSAVGSLVEECPPGKIVLPDQFIDWTKGKRPRTFFEKGVVGHVSCADPICLELKNKVSDICQNLGIDYQNGGNYICIEGPQFSTRFESRFYKSMGATIIGMTNIPEGYLAKEAGISYATVALVTDYDAWKEHHCTTDEIIKTMNKNIAKAQKIVLGIVSSEAITKLEVEPQNKNCLISNTSHLSPQMTSNLATLLEMSTSDPIKHKSVLSREVLSLIQASYESRGEERDFLIGDFTFGQGGHSFSILEQFSESKILAFDHDRQAFNHAQKLIGETSYGDRLELINDNFVNFEKYLEGRSFNFILIDLGVSTNQILNPERGFSFKNDGPLDMRMDQGLEQTAKDIVNTYSQEELEKILYTFGEESFTKNIVKNILEHREKEEIQTTKELENIIFHSIPKKLRYRRTHPATKTFQALRIFINKELEVLEKTLDKIKQSMKSPSQIAIISFHSLEDRIVKTVFRNWSKQSKSVRLVTKKPVQASRNEKLDNKRSRSAKMRAVKFLSEAEE